MLNFEGHKLSVEIDGKFYNDFISYRIESSYMTPTDGWEFVISDPKNPAQLRRTFQPWRPITLFINGAVQVLGRIDGNEGTGQNGTDLRVFGRDYLADFVDGGVDPSLRFSQTTTMEQAVLAILKPFGILTAEDDYSATRQLRTGRSKTHNKGGGKHRRTRKKSSKGPSDKVKRAAELRGYKADYDEGAFELANRILSRHSLTVQPSTDRGSVVFAAPDYDQDPSYILRRAPASGGQVEAAKAKRDWSQVPTVTIATARAGDAGAGVAGLRFEKPTFGVDALTDFWKLPEIRRIVFGEDFAHPSTIGFRFNPKGGAAGNAGLIYRPMFFRDPDSRTADQLESVVRRIVSEKIKSTLEYSCTVQGHADLATGSIYSVDTIAQVTDGVEDIEENLWISEVALYNDGTGSYADLTMIRPNSYLIGDINSGH